MRIEDARFQQLLFGYQNSVLKASQEVEDAVVGFVKAQEAAAAQENAVTAARRSVELAFLQYREGAVDFLRVLDAERTQLQEENSLVRIRSSVVTNLISLYKSLGGGWETSADQPFVSEETRKRWRNGPTGAITSNRRRPPTRSRQRPSRKISQRLSRTTWPSKISKTWIIIAAVVVVGGVLAYQYWKSMQSALPPGIVSGNGRIEAQLVDASAKEPLRVKEVLVNEGDLVKPGHGALGGSTRVTLEAELRAEQGRATLQPPGSN